MYCISFKYSFKLGQSVVKMQILRIKLFKVHVLTKAYQMAFILQIQLSVLPKKVCM